MGAGDEPAGRPSPESVERGTESHDGGCGEVWRAEGSKLGAEGLELRLIKGVWCSSEQPLNDMGLKKQRARIGSNDGQTKGGNI